MTDRPRICFVALNAFPLLADGGIELVGGAELQQVFVARGLAERGYPVCMVCRDFGQRHGLEIDKIKVLKAFRRDDGVPLLRFVWPRLAGIWRCLREADADIYYQRAAGMQTGLIAAFCARNGRRSIFAAAGDPDLERNTSRIRYWRDRWIYEYGIRNVDRIFVQSQQQATLCLDNFGRQSILVPNCYPAPAAPSVSGEPRSRYVLWVSTIRKIKRPEIFLDLAQGMPAHRFRMIGGPGIGEERLYRTIQDRAAGISNLEFTGFVSYSRIDAHFDGASVVVNTSESEGFPNTFLQAWSRGLPTLSFVSPGVRYEGQPIGRQVASADEMRDCLGAWLRNDEVRTGIGRTCRRYYEEHHSPDRVLDLYETVFRDVLGR